MNTVIRYQVGDYLGITSSNTTTYYLMGAGFNSLDESPAAKIDTTAYINDKSASGVITGYETTFAYDTNFISDEEAVKALYDVGRNQATGGDAEFDYIRVDLYETASHGSYPARKFKVSNEVSTISGAGTEIMKITGTLHQVGNFKEGWFNPTTKTWSDTEPTQDPV